jgi:hypothetical protein
VNDNPNHSPNTETHHGTNDDDYILITEVFASVIVGIGFIDVQCRFNFVFIIDINCRHNIDCLIASIID